MNDVNLIVRPRQLGLQAAFDLMRQLLVPMFTIFFLVFTLLYAAAATVEFLRPIMQDGDLIEGLVKGLHMGVVALAVYELSQIIYQEYDPSEEGSRLITRMRRGIIRFVAVSCTALVLEALIMVIKYSQKDLVGFLLYPVAIVAVAALLLMSLGVFAKLTIHLVSPEKDS